MTEREKIEYAKSFIDKMANGINPIDGRAVSEDDTLNNVRISRCLFYVSDILRRVANNEISEKPRKRGKAMFEISPERLSEYKFSDYGVAISEIAKKLYDLADDKSLKRLTYKDISGWLVSVGMLEEKLRANGTVKKHPTEAGEKLGIYVEPRTSASGSYEIVLYNRQAQQFIVDNIEAIISYAYED